MYLGKVPLFSILSLILSNVTVGADEYVSEGVISQQNYLSPIENERHQYQQNDYNNINDYFQHRIDEKYHTIAHHGKPDEINHFDNYEPLADYANLQNLYNQNSGEYYLQYASEYHHKDIPHNSKEDYHNYNNGNRKVLQHNSYNHQHFNQAAKGQKEHYMISKPRRISDPPLRRHPHASVNIFPDVEINSELFKPSDIAEYSFACRSRSGDFSDNRFVTYSNAPNSVFNTQVNVDSSGGKLNVVNNVPFINDAKADASDVDVVGVSAEKPRQESVKDISVLDMIYSPKTVAEVKMISGLYDDGYRYERPSVNFNY